MSFLLRIRSLQHFRNLQGNGFGHRKWATPEYRSGQLKRIKHIRKPRTGSRPPKPEFVPSDWETLVSTLQRGSFDAIVNGLEPTGDRARQIQFSKPYYIFQLALTVRNDEQQIHSLADCRDRVVGTLGNTAADVASLNATSEMSASRRSRSDQRSVENRRAVSYESAIDDSSYRASSRPVSAFAPARSDGPDPALRGLY